MSEANAGVQPKPYVEALAAYVERVAELAYTHGYMNGGRSGLVDDALADAAPERAAEYVMSGFDEDTVRDYAPSLGFTREDVALLRSIAHNASLGFRFGDGPQPADDVRSLADRIAALLPPETI